jgi:hypothetical protein
VQFQQRNHEAVRLVQDALLSREENKQRHSLKTSQGIYAIGTLFLGAETLHGGMRPSKCPTPALPAALLTSMR